MNLDAIEKIKKEDIVLAEYRDLINLYLHIKIFKFQGMSNVPNYISNPGMLASFAIQMFNNPIKINFSDTFYEEAVSIGQVKKYKNPKPVWVCEMDNLKTFGMSLGEALARVIILNYE